MTIHQPSAIVFDMLDDLLLMESGKVVFNGKIKEAPQYFATIGYLNSDDINPADYYLELAQKPIEGEDGASWNSKFTSSTFGDDFKKNLTIAALPVEVETQSQPSFMARFVYMLKYFFMYLLKQPSFFVLKMFALIALALFLGSLYLDLQPTTENIQMYSGAMFIEVITFMLIAISSTGLYAYDREEAYLRVKNGMFSPGLYVLSQTIVSAIYNLFIVFVFVCIFHWMTNLNPNKECFIYDILINWGHILLMDSFLGVAIEVVKNDFLCVSLGMVFMGTCMLFSGFFRFVTDSPAWINWMCYMLPLKVLITSLFLNLLYKHYH